MVDRNETPAERLIRMETFILDLGTMCDSPDSLRRSLAELCEDIAQNRRGTRLQVPSSDERRWKKWLRTEE